MSKKQVILMMTDTQRKDMLTCYNPTLDMNTPYLDSIAHDGFMFEHAYTAQPVCGPARSALFTGTYPHTNGSIANSMSMNQRAKTIGQRLRSHQIHTAYIGKYHLDGGDYFGDGLCPDGWDPSYWFDMRNYLDQMSEEDRRASRHLTTATEIGILPSFTYAHQCSDKAIEFIKAHRDEDYFLVVSYDEPHDPSLAPKEYYEAFIHRDHTSYGNTDINLINPPEHIRIWAKSQDTSNRRATGLMGCNAYVDKEVGRVLKAIDYYCKGACIIYTSDHGAAIGAHGLNDKGPAMYEEITNVPLLIKWPGMIYPSIINNQPVSHIDLVPTILDIFSIKKEPSLEGHSLMPIIKDSSALVNHHVFMEFTRYEIDHDGFGGFQPIRCVTDGHHKLVINLLTTDELYDTLTDPGETRNLLLNPHYKSIRNGLHDSLLRWMNETRDPYRGYYWERRPWREDAREASWDYTGMTRQRNTEADEIGQLDYATGLPITEYTRVKNS